jgi:hypothetical protein
MRAALDPAMVHEMLPGEPGGLAILPPDLAEASEGAPEVAGVELARGVVVREVACPGAIRPNLDGAEGLVGERADGSARPGGALGGPGHQYQGAAEERDEQPTGRR